MPPERTTAAVDASAQPLPGAFTIEGAVAFSGLPRSHIYEAIGRNDLDARKAGRRTLIEGDSLRAYLAKLPRAYIRMGRKAA